MREELLKLAIISADTYNIPKDWVLALIKIESNWDYLAMRYEPKWRYLYKPEYFSKLNHITVETEIVVQSCSFGLMQVMGTVSRELGHTRQLLELAQPALGLKYGCMKLASLIKKYGENDDAIAAYNAGSPRKIGLVYENQIYVNKFHKALNGVLP